MYKIMLVDDEENILKSLHRSLRKQKDLDIEAYLNATDALKRANSCIFDLVISDCRMPGIDGLEFLRQLKEVQPDAMRIVLTGAVNIETLMSAINKAGAFRFIAKPWDDEILVETIREGLRFRDIMVENRMLAARVREQENELQMMAKSLDNPANNATI
ncbi:MAG: response regulator [Pseudomonadales bacterium]|nr:response regulator [Pseudomonadales bacterium]